MRYRKSTHRVAFEDRIGLFLKTCRQANKLDKNCSDIRDMVFQCSILQACAALETYLKLLVESWAFNVRTKKMVDSAPAATRAYFISRKLNPHFSQYQLSREEGKLIENILGENILLWHLVSGSAADYDGFDGRQIHDEVAYPSYKNIKKLFARLGIRRIDTLISRNLRRDAETLVTNFQSIRTALAHSAPPNITLKDVTDRLSDVRALVGAIDRIFYDHVLKHGGSTCWT